MLIFINNRTGHLTFFNRHKQSLCIIFVISTETFKTDCMNFYKKLFLLLVLISSSLLLNSNISFAQDRPSLVNAANKTLQSVVHIKTIMLKKSNVYSYYYDEFGNVYRQGHKPNYFVATGSGVILTQDGLIVTNNHVVAGAYEISVTLNDKRTYKARIVGRDPSTDLAVIKIDVDNLDYIEFGNSDIVNIGEWVLAVGNPFNLTSTVTAGIVSAKARDIHLVGPQHSSAIDSYIQTDAAVNSGNSGGALVNENGLLIGINAAIASNTGSYTGYSFAIPSNIVKKVVGDLIQYGKVKRAFLGVQIGNLTQEIADYLDLNNMEGVYIAKVIPGGSADLAGIKAQDIIVKIDDQVTNSRSELLGKLGQYQPGETIIVRVIRKNKAFDLNLVLGSDNQD